LSISDYSLLT